MSGPRLIPCPRCGRPVTLDGLHARSTLTACPPPVSAEEQETARFRAEGADEWWIVMSLGESDYSTAYGPYVEEEARRWLELWLADPLCYSPKLLRLAEDYRR